MSVMESGDSSGRGCVSAPAAKQPAEKRQDKPATWASRGLLTGLSVALSLMLPVLAALPAGAQDTTPTQVYLDFTGVENNGVINDGQPVSWRVCRTGSTDEHLRIHITTQTIIGDQPLGEGGEDTTINSGNVCTLPRFATNMSGFGTPNRINEWIDTTYRFEITPDEGGVFNNADADVTRIEPYEFRFTYHDTDADGAAIIASRTELQVSEDGAEQTLELRMSHEFDTENPVWDELFVTVTPEVDGEIEIIPSTVLFEYGTAPEDQIRTLTIRGLDDDALDGPVAVPLRLTLTDEDDNRLDDLGLIALPSITVVNEDDDQSVLQAARREAEGQLLQHHVQQFSSLTSSAALAALSRAERVSSLNLRASRDRGLTTDGLLNFGAGSGGWQKWAAFSWADIAGEGGNGRAGGLWLGADYRPVSGDHAFGALIGYEEARLSQDETRLESGMAQLAVYGARRLAGGMILDGAIGYGKGTPDLVREVGGVTTRAGYQAERYTIRTGLTGDYRRGDSQVVTINPRVDLLYSENRLGAYTDSDGGIGTGETLRLARVSLGPKLEWRLGRGRLTGTLQLDWSRDNLGDDGQSAETVSAATRWRMFAPLGPGLVDLQIGIDGVGRSGYRSTTSALSYKVEF